MAKKRRKEKPLPQSLGDLKPGDRALVEVEITWHQEGALDEASLRSFVNVVGYKNPHDWSKPFSFPTKAPIVEARPRKRGQDTGGVAEVDPLKGHP